MSAETVKRPTTIDNILVFAVKHWPDAPYLYFEGKCWTFRDVEAAVDRTATALLELGVFFDD